MNSQNQNQPNMDEILNSIRDEQADPAVVEGAANRVWARVSSLDQHAAKIRGCADFQAMIPDWKEGRLADSRKVLLEDHIHECVACRKAAEAGRVIQFPRLAASQAPMVRKTMWQIPAMRMAMAAAMFAVLGIGGWRIVRSMLQIGARWVGSQATVQTADGQLFRLHGSGLVPVKAGEQLPAGEEVRTGRDGHAVIKLKDGSLVEMRDRSAFTVEETPSDLRVKLSRGAVIVQAAKRGTLGGHLYVDTPDCRVAVTGTVFSVDSGVKGSRVSVAEGEVHVSPAEGSGETQNEVILHPGDQTSTDPSMERTSVRDEFSWSSDAAKHVALLQEAVALHKELEKIQQPGMRYQSRILDRLPASTTLYMAIPNIGQQLGQVQQVMSRRVQESPVLQQWWKDQGTANETFNKVIDSLRAFGEYVGDEVVITAAYGPNDRGKMSLQAPILVAELKRGGFKEFAEGEFRKISGDDKNSHVRFVDDAANFTNQPGDHLLVSTSDNMLVISPDARALRMFAPGLKTEAAHQRGATPFLTRLEQSYQQGVGFLFAADLGTMSATIANQTDNNGNSNGLAPLGNVSMLVVEQRDAGTTTDTHALLTFSGKRQGIFGWLGAPSPMAGLEYVTAQAVGVSSFAIHNPGQIIDDILDWTSKNNPNGTKDLAQVEAELGFSLRNDLAASLGSEFIFAIDGPLLPVPSWKIVTEVYDPQKLQWVFSKMVEASNRKITSTGGQPLQSTQTIVGDLTYYRIVYPDAQPLAEIDYVFTGGYLIAAPSRTLLDAAIQAKATGNSLPRSAAFRAALPHDRQANFSALAYQNFGTSLNGLMNSLNSQVTAQQRQNLQTLAAQTGPSLIGAYGEEDRIVVSTQGLASLGSATLMKLTGPLSVLSILGDHHGTKH